MTTHVAFLRGIGPGNPNMSNERLRGVFDKLGFKNVESVISSGNIIFETGSTDRSKLENDIEQALKAKLGIPGGAFVRSKPDLEKMIKKDPFKGQKHEGNTYLIVSFLKVKPFEIYTSLSREEMRTPQAMAAIEKMYKKNVTTRTWKTLARVLARMAR